MQIKLPVKHKIIQVLLFLASIPIATISVYFGKGLLIWWGMPDRLTIILSAIIVVMTSIIFQTAFYYLIRKKLLIAIILFSIFGFFVFISVFGTVVGMNMEAEKAYSDRIKKESNSKDDPVIKNFTDQINKESKSVDDYQIAYKEEKDTWAKYAIGEKLEAAKKSLDEKANQLKTYLADKENQSIKKELFVDQSTGMISKGIKIFLAIAFGIIIDLSHCLLVLFSWILIDKKEQDSIENNNEKDYIDMYANLRVVKDKKTLTGMPNCVEKGIPPSIYNRYSDKLKENKIIKQVDSGANIYELCEGKTKQDLIDCLRNK